jgi:hypothetical protein
MRGGSVVELGKLRICGAAFVNLIKDRTALLNIECDDPNAWGEGRISNSWIRSTTRFASIVLLPLSHSPFSTLIH